MAVLARTVGGAVFLLALASCSLTTSFDGLTGGGDDADAAQTPASSEAGPGDPLDAGGGADDGGALVDGATPPPPITDGCSLDGCFELPDDFVLTAYAPDDSGIACPSGFFGGFDTVEGPSVGAGACTCGCTVTAQPSCTGTIVGHFGTGGAMTCPSAGGDLANTTACSTDGFLGPFTAGNEHRYKPPAPSGGACTSSLTKSESKLSFAAKGRACLPNAVPVCDGKVCAPALAPPFAACLAHAGDATCPPSFPNKHLVGSAATFSCSNACTCSVVSTCKGTLNYYTSSDCSGGASPFTVRVDDACHATDAASSTNTFGSHRFTADPATCAKTGSTTALAPTLVDETTFCCK
jgi:hypothetical protein